jgi:hypothetical protein
VAQGLDISELQVNPSLVTTDENALALRGLGGRNAGVVAVEANAGAGENNAGVERGQRPALGSLRGILAEALRMAQLRPRAFFTGWLETYLSERMSALESLASEHFWVFNGEWEEQLEEVERRRRKVFVGARKLRLSDGLRLPTSMTQFPDFPRYY